MKKAKVQKNYEEKSFMLVIIFIAVFGLMLVSVNTSMWIKKSKQTLETSVISLAEAAKKQCLQEKSNQQDVNVYYTIEEGVISSKLDVNNLPDHGYIKLDAECNVDLAISDNSYCAIKKGNDISITSYLADCKSDIATAEDCFNFDEETKTIVNYSGKMECPKDVVIPSKIGGVTVERIGNQAFYNKQLTSVIIPNSIKTIDSFAFYTNNIKSVVIPNSVVSLGFSAFDENQLRSVIISKNITSIEAYAFSNNHLKQVVIPDSVTSIGAFAFLSNNITKIRIPKSVETIEKGAFNDNQLSNEQAFIYARKANGEIDNTSLISYGGYEKESVVIPDTVTTIGDHSFFKVGLTSVTIPDSVTRIGSAAFLFNNLLDIYIGSGIKSIASDAFPTNNRSLVMIDIDRSTDTVSGSPWGATGAMINWSGSN